MYLFNPGATDDYMEMFEDGYFTGIHLNKRGSKWVFGGDIEEGSRYYSLIGQKTRSLSTAIILAIDAKVLWESNRRKAIVS